MIALIRSEPKLIIEVLSPSTTAYDWGVEFSHYRSLPSLQACVLVDLDTRSNSVYRPCADGLRVLSPFAGDDVVQLARVALDIAAAQLFAEI